MHVNRLYYGDNLSVLKQHVQAESVDLVYLDPPFNSARSYNVIFERHQIEPNADAAQIQAFDDTWVWTPVTEQQYATYVGGDLPNLVADALSAMRTLLGENDAMAYLVNMAPRLVQLYRVLKPSGTLVLHCDPTMSHYLKIILDAIFGAGKFINEIIWQRTTAHNRTTRFGPVHDVLLVYGKGTSWTWNPIYTPYTQEYIESTYRSIDPETGRRFSTEKLTASNPGTRYEWNGVWPSGNQYWGVSEETMKRLEAEGRLYYSKTGLARLINYLDQMPGRLAQDVWTDIPPIGAQAAERLGYPTQKPVALMERILNAFSNTGDLVLDPFCGCGTTVDAAQKLGRNWIGIDITYLSVDLIEKRLEHIYGHDIRETYEVLGIPRDRAAALALFSRSPFDFERWAVSLVSGQPNQKQVGDKGIDGVARFPLDGKGAVGRVLVSVKGGKQLNPAMVRDLGGTVWTQKAEMGVLITNTPPTRGMIDEANHAGTYQHPHYAQAFPRIQLITVDELLSGKRPQMPPTILPYIQALKAKTPADQGSLFDT
jgi:DNA modification methylase